MTLTFAVCSWLDFGLKDEIFHERTLPEWQQVGQKTVFDRNRFDVDAVVVVVRFRRHL
jgi:hypothetical protein